MILIKKPEEGQIALELHPKVLIDMCKRKEPGSTHWWSAGCQGLFARIENSRPASINQALLPVVEWRDLMIG